MRGRDPVGGVVAKTRLPAFKARLASPGGQQPVCTALLLVRWERRETWGEERSLTDACAHPQKERLKPIWMIFGTTSESVPWKSHTRSKRELSAAAAAGRLPPPRSNGLAAPNGLDAPPLPPGDVGASRVSRARIDCRLTA